MLINYAEKVVSVILCENSHKMCKEHAATAAGDNDWPIYSSSQRPLQSIYVAFKCIVGWSDFGGILTLDLPVTKTHYNHNLSSTPPLSLKPKIWCVASSDSNAIRCSRHHTCTNYIYYFKRSPKFILMTRHLGRDIQGNNESHLKQMWAEHIVAYQRDVKMAGTTNGGRVRGENRDERLKQTL